LPSAISSVATTRRCGVVVEPGIMQYRSTQQFLNNNARINHSPVQQINNRRVPRLQRLQLIQLLNSGYGLARAARKIGISVSGARYVMDRIVETNTLRNRKFQIRVLQDPAVNKMIVQTLEKNRRIKTKQLHSILEENGFELSLRQLRYRISVLGFRYKKMKRVQVISPKNQQKRLLARAFWDSEGYPFDKYLFVDECTVVLGREQQWCWARRGEKIPCQGRLRHGDGFHIFAGISYFGATDILIWPSKARMNSAFYCAHNLKDIVIPAKSLFPGGIFQLAQDNHKCHVSFDTLEFLKNHGINTYDWPPQSPEFNPIEFVWRDLKAYIA
jgi:transposase